MIAHLRRALGPEAPPIEESPTAVAAETVRILPDRETASCQLLGYHRVELVGDGIDEEAMDELRAAAADKGGDTVGIERDRKGGRTVVHANIVRCR